MAAWAPSANSTSALSCLLNSTCAKRQRDDVDWLLLHTQARSRGWQDWVHLDLLDVSVDPAQLEDVLAGCLMSGAGCHMTGGRQMA